VTMEDSAFRIMVKLHAETECGSDEVEGLHSAQCEAMADAFGFDSFEAWGDHRNDRTLRALDGKATL
jgi:hypothetical protein